jgi:glycosidase
MLSQDFVYNSPETSLVTFADNHDIDRIYNMLGKSLAKVKMAMTLICTTRGLPQLYYGTELLFENDKRGGPHQARPDFPGGWEGDSINLFADKNRSAEQREMFNHTRTLLHFRKKTEALHNGRLMHYMPEQNVYTYFRYTGKNECVMVVINASKEDKAIRWERFWEHLSDKNTGIEILSNKTINKNTETIITAENSMVIHFK